MTRMIDFYFDFPSPYACLAHTQLLRLAAEHGATVECRNKSKYAGADLQRWVRRTKAAFSKNPHPKSFDFAEPDRAALVAIENGRGAGYVTAIFVGDQMFFGNDRLDFVAEALRSAT